LYSLETREQFLARDLLERFVDRHIDLWWLILERLRGILSRLRFRFFKFDKLLTKRALEIPPNVLVSNENGLVGGWATDFH